MYAMIERDDYSACAPYMPTYHSHTGRFKLDQTVAVLMSRHSVFTAFDTQSNSLLASCDYRHVAIVEPEREMLFFDTDRRGPSAIDIQAVFGGTVVSTTLIPPSYHVVFVGHPSTIDADEVVKLPVSSSVNIPSELTTPHADLLKEIIKSRLWSLRELTPILGLSHQQIARVAKGSTPSWDVGHRIDELHRFFKRVQRLVDGNAVAMRRLLSTSQAGEGMTAAGWLQAKDFRKAFSAVMDAASPTLALPEPERLPLRRYDRPSTAIEDLERRGR